MQTRGPPRGYFPDPTKSILVVPPRNVPREDEFFREMGAKIVTGSRYLGGLVGDGTAEEICLEEKGKVWAESAKTLVGVSHKNPQYAYAGMQKSLQQEWTFMQRVAPGIGYAFGTVEESLR